MHHGARVNEAEFLERIERHRNGYFGWSEHETAARTSNTGGQREGEPDFSHQCEVHTHLRRALDEGEPRTFMASCWWKWTAKVSSGGVKYRARGYAKSMEEGKKACERAVRTLALGVLAQWKETH